MPKSFYIMDGYCVLIFYSSECTITIDNIGNEDIEILEVSSESKMHKGESLIVVVV